VKGAYAIHQTVAPSTSVQYLQPKGTSARYVMVRLDVPTAQPLQLAEVQVLG
jgi:hypothetical protein